MDIISLPVIISKEGKWFVACCPVLDIATQGRNEKEVKENIRDLIEEYMEDPDTQKPELNTIMSTSITMISIPVKIRSVYLDTKTSPTTTT
ncbi:MAG: type II toxin-antitoxin system HicB family antitoxin [Methanosarcinales archaeon]